MRNLRIVSFDSVNIKGDLPLTATAWDTSNDSVICAFGPSITSPIIELKRKIKLKSPVSHDSGFTNFEYVSITSWDAPCPLPDMDSDEILLMHYFPDNLTICLVLAGGDLVLIREEPEEGQEKIEIVGSVDVGILAAAWAPDEELLAIVTRSDNLVLMSRDLEPVTEAVMAAEDLQASKHVSVGWGKKETQFHGKRAKAMRDPTMPDQIDEGIPSSCEDGRVTVTWRGDGAYLAVNSFVQDHRRVIRVYSREGSLDSISEPVNGLESSISWRPTGNLIAGIKRSTHGDQTKLEVIFFERNGLRHGEFPLRLDPTKIGFTSNQISLSWNLDSTVLAVALMGSVQYWTMGNYHYYLKQQVNVTQNVEHERTGIVWHPEKPLKCSIHNKISSIEIEYLSYVNKGLTVQPNDYGITAVIDGSVLKLSPLKHVGVPPPMSFCEVNSGSNIIDVAINNKGEKLAILTFDGLEIWDWKMRDTTKTSQRQERRHTTAISKRQFSWQELGNILPVNVQFTQIGFQGSSNIFTLAPAQQGCRALCFRVKLQDDSSLEDSITDRTPVVEQLEIPAATQNLLTDNLQETAWVQSAGVTSCIGTTGSVEHVSKTDLQGTQPNSVLFEFKPRSDMDTVNGSHPSYHKISLTSKGSLLVDQRVLARDCTSFVLTNLHLIYTTAQHLLKFVHIAEPDNMEVPGDTPEVDERCRSIERGAKIVTVIPSIYAVVLQMPRGNLETIYPRVLVLNGIRESLRDFQYRTAFTACQNHQVDLNILHDYSPEDFTANIKKFIDDLKKPSRVDEFLSKLKEEDVTETLYKDTLNASTDSTTPAVNGVNLPAHGAVSVKINKVCDAFITILQQKPGKFLQCVITAHVCKRPPDLTAALSLVSSLRQTSTEEADLAVSHLCFLTDTNRLYDAALALYDLELTLLVAQNAQRDPREYMPFLQNLQSLPTFRRQYQIDNHLKNYDKALTSLHSLEVHEEVEAYTIKHSLYTHALDLYKYSPVYLSKTTNLYAEHLATQSQHAAAAILYESLNNYEQACSLYALAHQWREALTCATLIPLDQTRLHQLALTLANNLAEESRDYRSAATIHTEYLSDPSTAARLLCKGSYFGDATRLLSLHNLVTEIPSTIDSGLGDKFSEILELVSDCKSQLTAQIPRIQELRVKKAEDPLAFYGGDATAAAADGFDIPDNVSLAPTDATTAGGQSLFTRYGGGSQGSKFAGTVMSNVSRKTSKTKRREERKRARGKKGSVYEEEYLVASVGRLIERVNGVHDEVTRLVSGLMRRGMRDRAVKVGEVMKEIETACGTAKVEIWGAEQKGDEQGGSTGEREAGEDSWRPSGADGVFWDSQQNPAKKNEAPVVKAWKGVSWV